MPYYPPEDSRSITDYRSIRDINGALALKYNLKNNHEFKTFMQKNGASVLADLQRGPGTALCKECPVCSAKF